MLLEEARVGIPLWVNSLEAELPLWLRFEAEVARTGFGIGLEAKLFVVVTVVVLSSVSTPFSIVTSFVPPICSLVAAAAPPVIKFWRLALGIPRAVISFTRYFSSLALFILSSCFYIVFCCLSEAASLAALDYFALVGLRLMLGANVHSSAYFSKSYCSRVLSILSVYLFRYL